MINDFLKKYQEELISEKIQIKEDIDLLETKIKEENKFLTLLEESNETYFKEFTPRDINAKNNKKAEEIKEKINDLQSQLDTKSSYLKFYDGRLNEISNLLLDNSNTNNSFTGKDDNKSLKLNQDSEVLISQLNEVKSMIVLDPYRAQIELEKIICSL